MPVITHQVPVWEMCYCLCQDLIEVSAIDLELCLPLVGWGEGGQSGKTQRPEESLGVAHTLLLWL